MKRVVIGLLLGVILGAAAWHCYQRTLHPALGQRAEDLADRARDKAAGIKVAIAEKSSGLGDAVDDARIVAVIKTKFFMDRELSALAISVDCADSRVVLTGSTTSPELIRRAVDLTRRTAGVRSVNAKLQVRN